MIRDGPSICLCLSDCFDGLVHVSTHSDLCNIDITVGHSDFSKALLSDCFTSCSELCNLTDLRSLGSLTAGVGVNFGIEYHDVDIFTGSQNVVYAAEADIVCPTVAAEDPNRFLGEVFFLGQNFFCFVTGPQASRAAMKFFSSSLVCFAVVYSIQIFLTSNFN